MMVRAGANGGDEVQVFRGNLTTADHFHELFVEPTSLLLGARLADSPVTVSRLRRSSCTYETRSFRTLPWKLC